MAFPPFPSQDLAKLVLGYLAEEQLMTAYDEFLQASPYLDAFRNEYDRIFMTSLKNILAEYRAVKIYVETCKPFVLRRKLFQCTNLLEVVKVLVSYIDINRLHTQEISLDKSSYKSGVYSKTNVCETCSLSTGACICKSSKTSTLSSQNEMSIDTSIETTSLADLPGNSVTKKRPNKDLIDVVQPSYNNSECGITTQNPLISRIPGETVQVPINSNLKQDVTTAKTDESKQKIEEFNTILNLVCSNNDSYQKTNFVPLPTASTTKTIGSAGTFQEFAKGVTGRSDTEKSIVPDSSTSDSCNAQLTDPRETFVNITPITNIKGPPKQQILLTVGTPHTMQNRLRSNFTSKQHLPHQKPEDQKITILSDIKVDNTFKNNIKMPPVLKSTTSTPLLQFQTILINGTPAYKPHTPTSTINYTKDEIMAMPTLFVVSATGPSTNPSPVTLRNTNAQSTTVTTTSNSSKTNLLGPLVIDVPANDPLPDSSKLPDLSSDPKNKPEMSLVTTVDLTHGSLPKNTNLTLNKSSTPHILPPTRKSSSTPRRSSHIRVLDFTTPRRILNETINEQEEKPEVILIPDVPVHTNIISSTPSVASKLEATNKNMSIKEKDVIAYKKRNWDTELRVLAVRNDDKFVPAPIPKPKIKKSKKKTSETSKDKKDSDESKDTVTPRSKKSKKKRKSVEIIEQPIDVEKNSPDLIIVESKPIADAIINCKETSREIEKVDTKIVEERVDTPENDRIALQNVIGAKLNISDFLETPYKQVLYDIQMETPKFLGQDMPDEPMSDIKIMSIPTPLFLNTPKPMLTPASSRPTDYSSGGSYYKPDDQDYVLTSEVMKCAVTIEDSPKATKTETLETEEKVAKSNRPRRTCTKYVSYYKSPVSSKTVPNIAVDKQEVASEPTEITNNHSREKKTPKLSESKKTKTKSKSESKKKSDTSTIKLPLKKPTPKKFMRIKPRRTTPVKEVYNKSKKKSDNSPKVVIKSRIRTSSKNKSILAPIIVAAPTKSRRKSSTPRKIQCTKSFNSDFDANTSDDKKKSDEEKPVETNLSNDSDLEQLSLRWSDDGSQDSKVNQGKPSSTVDEEDISKIKEYIETASPHTTEKSSDSLHVDLIKRGFDVETAKSIERDLLDTTPGKKENVQSVLEETSITQVSQNISNKTVSGSSKNSLEIAEDEAEEDEVEFTVHDCEEGSDNYMTCIFDETTFIPKEISKLKEKYSMELCIDDGVSIRLRATNFSNLFHKIPEEPEYNYKETVAAVNSICDIDQLYTPMKQRGLTCQDLFNSTLTSLDTPLKSNEIKETYEETVTEIVLEVENTEVKDTKKRKRPQSGTMDELNNKKPKPETQYLLNSANIQNIDIESVLSKLHGP